MINFVIEREVDERLHIYENLEPIGAKAPLPAKFELKSHEPRFQGASLWCVGFSATALRYAIDLSEFGSAELLSPQFVMKYAKDSDGFPINDGTSLSAVSKVMRDKGVCTDKLLPTVYNTDMITNKFKPITSEMKEEAKKRRIDSYAAISTLSGLKDAIVNSHGALFAIRMFASPHDNYGFFNKPVGNHLSKHCMYACGYDDDYEVVISGRKYKGIIKLYDWYEDGSWGYKFFPYDYFSESKFRIEMMTFYDKNFKYPDYHQKYFDGLVVELYKDTIVMKLGSDKATVNGVEKTLTAIPQSINGVTMVGLRNCSEFFRGCYVTYDGPTKKITIYDQDYNKTYYMTLNSKTIKNGQGVTVYTMLEPPTLINGSTFIPVRAFAEVMGATVDYDTKTKVITIIR